MPRDIVTLLHLAALLLQLLLHVIFGDFVGPLYAINSVPF